MIHVFERFGKDEGEKYESISFNYRNIIGTDYVLDCKFRLPRMGVLYIPHPTDDKQCIKFEYETPSVLIENFVPCSTDRQYFTTELKNKWESLPQQITLNIGCIKLICKKDIIDLLECSADGFVYIYVPTALRLDCV